MNPTKERTHSSIHKYSLLSALIWTLVLAALFNLNLQSELKQASELATYQARAFFQDIVTVRYWNATHGGVYVPISENAQPNPYLDVPDREITTVDGRKLTKINPAYMTRQIGEIAAKKNQVWFHITSSNPIRPANAPDSWEAKALGSFATGVPEQFGFIRSPKGTEVFRYMAPLWVKRPCLKCHAKQGYKEGDLRGGISVSIEAGPILPSRARAVRYLTISYLTIWALGLIGLGIGMQRLRAGKRKRKSYPGAYRSAL